MKDTQRNTQNAALNVDLSSNIFWLNWMHDILYSAPAPWGQDSRDYLFFKKEGILLARENRYAIIKS